MGRTDVPTEVLVAMGHNARFYEKGVIRIFKENWVRGLNQFFAKEPPAFVRAVRSNRTFSAIS